MTEPTLSVKTVRKNCLECSGGWVKAVTWCQLHGLHSTRCEFWPFRFGVRPGSFRAKYGDRLLTPDMMPPPDLDLDLLPGIGVVDASTAEIDVPGYRQPAVELPDRPELSAEEKAKWDARFGRAPQHAPNTVESTQNPYQDRARI